MRYEGRVRGELEELSKSLGFQCVPKEELEDGLTRLRKGMEKEGMEAFLVFQKMGGYYPSGTTQDGLLFVSLEGTPLLMVRREVERARVEWPLEVVVQSFLLPILELMSIPKRCKLTIKLFI